MSNLPDENICLVLSKQYQNFENHTIFNIRGDLMLETIEFRKGILFLRLSGKLGKVQSDELLSYLQKLVDVVGIKYLAINLSDLTSITEAGIQVIDQCAIELSQRGGNLILCGNDQKVVAKTKKFHFSDILKVPSELSVFDLIHV